MKFTDELLQWYDKNKRDLPWRETKDPYAVWVSEIMLQQTRVDTAIAYYLRFMERFRDVRALADASEEEVLNLWKGLGYYSRARNMHKAAKIVAGEYGGVFPREPDRIARLPGVGRYTAGAVASIACGVPAAAVDGNVLRVMTRFCGLTDDIAQDATKRKVEKLVEGLIPHGRPGDFTQAMMELGALVCLPQQPACAACPVAEDCRANREGTQEMLPVKQKSGKAKPVEEYWALYIHTEDKLLMEYRGQGNLLKNLWGLPLVVKEQGLDIGQLLRAQYGSGVYEAKGTVSHVFTHKTWRMSVVSLLLPRPVEKPPYIWVEKAGLSGLPIPTAFKKVLAAADR